jgi:hypothetical protein
MSVSPRSSARSNSQTNLVSEVGHCGRTLLGHRGTHRAASKIACPTSVAWARVSTVAVVIVASSVSTTRRTHCAVHQIHLPPQDDRTIAALGILTGKEKPI